MALTVVTGYDRTEDSDFYRVRLDAATGLVEIPDHLLALMPAAGDTVRHEPTGLPVAFSTDDPDAVWAWLSSSTYIDEVTGPDLSPPGHTDLGVWY